jgi:hypothetical protein
MTATLTPRGRQDLLTGLIDLDTDTLKAIAIDPATNDTAVKTITNASNATPIVITSAAHGFANGQIVAIIGVAGNGAANGMFKIANVTTNTFELTNVSTGAAIAGSGAYTSGGWVCNLTLATFVAAVDAGRIGADPTLTSPTVSIVDDHSVFNFTGPLTWAAVGVGPTMRMIFFYKSTGSAATDRIFFYFDTTTGPVALPIVANGSDITYTPDTGANKVFAF